MGQQQLLLIILGVIIVGIAIAVGLQLFQSGSIGANQDAIINDIMNISSHADQWRIRPVSMGGGGGVFVGEASDGSPVNPYQLPERMRVTGNAEYTAVPDGPNTITIRGTSTIHDGGWVELEYDATGQTDGERFTWSSDGTVFDIES